MQKILEKINNKKLNVKHEKERKSDQKIFVSNNELLKKTFSWKPMTNKIKGIALLYEWMVSNIEDLKKFNYKVKKQHLAFVDHSFHIKTRSGDFFKKYF